jgi:Ca2+-transporting ATPase
MNATLAAAFDAPALRRRWTAAFLAGELVGFAPPALTGATLAAVGAPDVALVLALTLAGAGEGAVIGYAQARVLATYAPAVDGRRWISATAAAAACAWFVGMGGGALLGSRVAPAALLVPLLVPAWAGALAGMGYAQWLVLRRAVPRSARWVPVTASAWLAGVMIPVVALSVVPNGLPSWVHAVVGVAAAVAMGLTVGTLTGRTLAALVAPVASVAPVAPARTVQRRSS